MSESPVRLEVQNVRWLPNGQDKIDLCAHGDVILEIDHRPAWRGESAELCVSAAALNLLRTLEADHTTPSPISLTLFPHCGHAWAETEEHGLINIGECPNGLNADLVHVGTHVEITSPTGRRAKVSEEEWARMVCAFADKVERHYLISEPKVPSAEDSSWYSAFWTEWRSRRARAATP